MQDPNVSAQGSDQMREAIRVTSDCHRICLETLNYGLERGGRHTDAQHVQLLLDCASICHLTADFMARGSEQHSRVCSVCAEICDLCAEDCRRFGDDQVMEACATACSRCADTCRQIAQMGG